MQYTNFNGMTLLYQTVKRDLTMTYYQKLIRYIDDLIIEKGKRTNQSYDLSIDDLDDSEQGILASLLLESNDRDTSDCYHESNSDDINDNITCSLINLLKNDSMDSKEDFATLVRKNVINKSLPFLEKLIQQQCEDVFQCQMFEAGMRAHRHYDGDIYWSKSA